MATVSQMAKSFAALDFPEIKTRVMPEGTAQRSGELNKNLLMAGIRAVISKLLEKLKSKKITASQLLQIFLALELFFNEVKSILSGDVR